MASVDWTSNAETRVIILDIGSEGIGPFIPLADCDVARLIVVFPCRLAVRLFN